MQNVRIAQVNAVIAEIYGGPSIGSVALNAKLRELGVDATLYSTGLNGARGARIDPDEIQRYDQQGAHTVIFQPAWPSTLQNGRKFFRMLLRQAPSCDLIHIHGQYQLPHIYAYVAAKWSRVPYGIQVHGGLEPYQRAKSRLKKRLYNFVIGSRILRDAAYVHFSSASEAQRASDVVRSDQEVVVPLGASLPAEQPVTQLSDVIGDANRGNVVLFLGRLTHKKRPDLLLEAWALADRPSGSILIVAGPDEDISASQLRRLAESLNIADSVYFPGQVTGPEKSWLYRNSGIFVLASENENFGLTIGEAMLGGCHVIASRGVAACSFLDASNSGRILSEMSEHTLAEVLSEALGQPARTLSSGRRASIYAEEHLSWRPLALKLAEIASQARQNA